MPADERVRKFQQERLVEIRHWYQANYKPLGRHTAPLIRYIVLWSVFNALYNVYDLRNAKTIQAVEQENGHVKPLLRGTGDRKKVKNIATCLASDGEFIRILVHEHTDTLRFLATRRPEVRQPDGTTELRFEVAGQQHIIRLDRVFGIASLDNRKFLSDGPVLFEYADLQLAFSDEDEPIYNDQTLMVSLALVLYQLRNNIVHGGSASFGMIKKQLAQQTIHILEMIVEHLLKHEDLVLA